MGDDRAGLALSSSGATGALALARTRREAIISISLWAGALVWTVGGCALLAPNAAGDIPVSRTTRWLGVPTWVLVGVVAPWLTLHVIASLFAIFGMSDEDLDRPPA